MCSLGDFLLNKICSTDLFTVKRMFGKQRFIRQFGDELANHLVFKQLEVISDHFGPCELRLC